MADDPNLDDDVDNENEQDDAGTKKKSRTTLILLVAVGVLLVALSVTGTLLAVHLMKPDPASVAAESEEGALSDGEELAMSEADATLADGAAEEEDAEPPKNHAIYYPIQPPLIVNFDARGRQRFLQAELALMTREDDVISAIELHMSMIRNSLILLIGSHLFEELQTAEGKEILRQQCLQEIQRLMEQEIGKPGVEQVLFTNFVMQ